MKFTSCFLRSRDDDAIRRNRGRVRNADGYKPPGPLPPHQPPLASDETRPARQDHQRLIYRPSWLVIHESDMHLRLN